MLLERDGELALLRGAVEAAAQRRGSVVLVTGEAGIGKSSLVRAWIADPGADARVLAGWCDDFITSRALAPLHDVARGAGGALADALHAADIGAVLEATITELSYPLGCTVLLLEDMHWADDATLDVVRYVGRRIAGLPAVLALTYRDDEVGPGHPLTGVLGSLSPDVVRRIVLRRLSRGAVVQLTAGTNLDADEVVRVTGGNPFFVTELAAGDASVPASVGDAVLARVRRLPEPARRAVEALAVVPGAAGHDLVRVLVPDLADLAPAERGGVLVFDDDAVRFRHELARQAVLTALPTTAQMTHHGRVLEHVLADAGDPARILHHAAGARRNDVIATHGPMAAAEASRAGAYREAVAYAERALTHQELLDPTDHARLLEGHAWALYNLHRLDEAAAAARRAVAIRAELDDLPARIRALLLAARMAYMRRAPDEAFSAVREARDLLPVAGDAAVEAEVCTQRLAMLHLTDHHDRVLAEEEVVRALTERVARVDLEVYRQVYTAGSRVLLGDDAGLEALAQAVTLGRGHGLLEPVARAYTNLVLFLVLRRRWAAAEERVEEAIRFYDDHDFRAHRYSAVAEQAHMLAQLGDWKEAAALLRDLAGSVRDAGVLEAPQLHANAMLAVRSGSPDAEASLTRAWRVCVGSRSAYLVPMACTAIEWAWMRGTPEAAEAYISQALTAAEGTVLLGPLRWHLALVGRPADATGVLTEPERTSLSGNWRAAARAWQELRMPFEQGVELLRSGEQELILNALRIFERLGAEPAGRMARRRLRALGVRSIPRGPAPTTRQNPFGLTDRQLDVLELIAEGLTNAEIAKRLVVSTRTVDHHVSAVLQKLGVSSRKEAAARAAVLSR